jgi:hypothetical protein
MGETQKTLLEGLVVIVIGLALLPVVISFVTSAKVNTTGAVPTLLDLVPVFWVLVVVGVGAAMIYKSMK